MTEDWRKDLETCRSPSTSTGLAIDVIFICVERLLNLQIGHEVALPAELFDLHKYR